MDASLAAFQERLQRPWLSDKDASSIFQASFNEALALFSDLPPGGRVLVSECGLPRFLGGALAALALKLPIFLADAKWTQEAWSQVAEVLRPDAVWGEAPSIVSSAQNAWKGDLTGKLMIPTGGSGGRVRFAYHSWESLGASVRATAAFLRRPVLNACCVLPLYHVSGFMQCLRTWMTGGVLALPSWKAWESGVLPAIDPEAFCLSLVPTQLERLMQDPANIAFLRDFRVIFLGGAPASAALLERAREARLPLSPTYGMTETGSMVAAMRPSDFLGGKMGLGAALEHAHLRVDKASGRLWVEGASLFQGYYPEKPRQRVHFETGDQAELAEDGQLLKVWRADAIIITGGEKVDPHRVVSALTSLDEIKAALVVGVPDSEWGERVVALIQRDKDKPLPDPAQLRDRLQGCLQPYQIPKTWLEVDVLPINEQGKVDPLRLRELMHARGILS